MLPKVCIADARRVDAVFDPAISERFRRRERKSSN